MNSDELVIIKEEINEVFVITNDDIDECLCEAIEK